MVAAETPRGKNEQKDRQGMRGHAKSDIVYTLIRGRERNLVTEASQ